MGVYILYNAAMILLGPVAALWLWLTRFWSDKFRGTLARRWGLRLPPGPAPDAQSVWIHAVSVGESTGAVGVVRRLLQQRPELRVYLSSTTKTGRAAAEKFLGDSVTYFYFPIDHPLTMARVLARIRPEAVGIMETELWPNLIVMARRRGIPVLMLNGRVSDRMAAAGGAVRALYRFLFKRMSLLGVQSGEDAARLVRLGAPEPSVRVMGNAKLDFMIDLKVSEEVRRAVERFKGSGRLFVAASTHPGEEARVLEAFVEARKRLPGLKLLLAPRHVERAAEAAGLVTAAGLELVRRSDGVEPGPGTAVFLLDTIGELVSALAAADAAFVGGSLVDRGGHNVLEPAALGVPTFYGPHTMNFVESVAILERGRASGRVRSPVELARALVERLEAPDAEEFGRRLKRIVADEAGAAERYAAALLDCMDSSGAGSSR